MARIIIIPILSFCFGFYTAATFSGLEWKPLDLSCNMSLDALHTVSNKTVVTLSNCTFVLTSPLNISGVQGLHIVGNDSVINCTGDNAGIMFTMVTDVLMEKLAIQNCGMFLSKDKLQIASVKIVDSSEVTIKNVTIENGKGTGLSLVNVGGNVTVENCIFNRNVYYVHQLYPIVNAKKNDFVQRGGGMQILANNLSCSTYQILRCYFTSNFASSGGGLFIVMKHAAKWISITIKNCYFVENQCENGGGGVQLGAVTEFLKSYQIRNNSIVFEECVFQGNEAGHGGGTAIFSSLGSKDFSYNKIEFNSCSWLRNIASGLGMAVDVAIAPWESFTKNLHDFPKPRFKFCNFTEHSHASLLSSSISVFTVTGFEIYFNRSILFKDNNGTAIEATSSVLNFKATNVRFINNQGINGGAMRLKGPSVILVRDNSKFLFQGNGAVERGGAIYVDSSDRYSASCFFENRRLEKNFKAIFNFSNNTGGFNKVQNINTGDSIYASSILSCLDKCPHHNTSVAEALNCIGNFKFDKKNLHHELASAPNHFSRIDISNDLDQLCKLFIVNSTMYWNQNFRERLQNVNRHKNKLLGQLGPVIPGREVKIPLKLVDELCEELSFHVSVEVLESNNGSIFISHSIITNNYITLYGNPQDYGIVQFSAAGIHDVTLSVQLTECPPGYIHNTDTKNCDCSVAKNLRYPGIERCDGQAYMKHGYWLGYLENRTATEKNLASAICPKGFCNSSKASEHALPSVAMDDLSSYVCNENRSGIICGICKENYSAYYRSTSFSCKSIDLCYLGWLFYILSELFPVTVLFFIVVYFNISFTSGALNGVILFMQIVTTFKIDGEDSIQFDETIIQFSRIHKIIYRIFTLKFFALEELSFCLWESATALDMLAFRYVTIVYSLFLVIITVIVLRKCTFRVRKSKQPKKEPSLNLKHSILNGLSAFLVMSYSECTQVSLMILTTGTLTVGPGNESNITSYEYQYVAFYNGNYEYRSAQHLKYAIPAITFLLTLVALPPILLIVYPLCYKLFALLRIDESKFVKIICKVIPLEKIKPIFDSIQGEFRDQCRFMAGMYFIYRFIASLTFTFASALETYYSATCLLLTVMLVLHSICCPYKKKWHNVLDAFLFANLLMINVVSFFNYTTEYKSDIQTLAGIQCGSILLPLVYLVVYTTYNIVGKIKAKMISGTTLEGNFQENNDNFLEMLDARNVDNSAQEPLDYLLLREN